jgi:hypothetical protein
MGDPVSAPLHDCTRCRRAFRRDAPAFQDLIECRVSHDAGVQLQALEAFKLHGLCEQPFRVVEAKGSVEAAAWPLLFHPRVISQCDGFVPLGPNE